MAFDQTKIAVGSTSLVSGDIPIQWVYKSTTDTLATILASGYFDLFASQFNIDDILYVSATDVKDFIRIVAVSPAVTSTQVIAGGAAGEWARIIGPPDFVIPVNPTDHVGATAQRIVKGWYTDLEVTNAIVLADGSMATTQSASDNSTQLATTAYVDAAVGLESIWNRATTIITPQNPGDNLNMIDGSIFTIDPANTSNTKSYEISETLTGSVSPLEHAEFTIKGLRGGSQSTFFQYFGASNSTQVTAEDWVFDNTIGTTATLQHKVNLNTVGGSGWFFNQVIGRNSASTETTYYQDRAIIAVNTASSESGIHVYDVMEGGTLTEYLRLDGATATILASKPVGIGGAVAATSAILELTSTDRVFLPTRMTTAQMNALTRVSGMLGYDTAEASLQTVTQFGSWSPLITADGNISLDANWNIGSNSIVGDVPIISLVVTGTAPIQVDSTTKVDNFNADLADGFHFDQALLVASTPQFAQLGLGAAAIGTIPLYASNTTTTGQSAYIHTNNTTNLNEALLVEHEGLGITLAVLSDNVANTSVAMSVVQNGTGDAATFMGGSVGIGTATPSEVLEVAGNIKSTIAATDGFLSIDNASSVETVRLDTNGISFLDGGSLRVGGDITQTVHTDDVSNPPTDAELDSIFGVPATVGAGFTAYIDDNNAGTNVYQVTSNGATWWTLTATVAV